MSGYCPVVSRCFVGLAAVLAVAWAQPPETGPSFSCAQVTSQVNRLICASGTLSALDRQLAAVFNNMRGQPLDQKKLRLDEEAWIRSLQRDCNDGACIQRKYEERLAELRDQSLRVASPAEYAETRPFPVPAALMAQARDLVGKACSYQPNLVGPVIPGFAAAPRFLPVILAGGVTVVRAKDGVRFAFLTYSQPGGSDCEIRDVVALPESAVGDRFLQCSVSDPALSGFGIRNTKTSALDAFWSVDPETRKIDRVAMGVLGIERAVKCRQPETGE
jgi:uncharacterized protein YecT (DUF1311 family)